MKNSKIIVQSESNDGSTDDVINWIKYLSNREIIPFFDVFKIDKFEAVIDSNDTYIKLNETKIHIEDRFWYRRGIYEAGYDKQSSIHQNLFINLYIQNEKTILNTANRANFFEKSINKFSDNDIEKLHMLLLSKQIGIQVPNVLITNNREKVANFIKKNKKVITKSLKHASTFFYYKGEYVQLSCGTVLVDDVVFNRYSKKFSVSFFQQYIEKKYEIRTFYMNGFFKSMAIFSQANEKTKVDFRNYDRLNPNRLVPYKLPSVLEGKLKILMDKLGLNSGSIDIICSPNGKYYFLEVNPIGQFQWLSRHCNYNLEKLIALELCK